MPHAPVGAKKGIKNTFYYGGCAYLRIIILGGRSTTETRTAATEAYSGIAL
jgi:hypothetical protein